ncbi:hypothetical protein CVPH_1222 [Abyssogena phaseoliformis symbiont OG214]|uniref:hypothetical protein n=1 Tax=Abyssogena phaseoliformis symbiont TaxID=596095 RepID=UPI001915DC2A|nr:hypothetical protein [Abyssogena phaseoliformis symbiont]BBB23121.1 hypothetical protein CVPH_1222 [Abyssogena phaseoliformis symbiont OG214]
MTVTKNSTDSLKYVANSQRPAEKGNLVLLFSSNTKIYNTTIVLLEPKKDFRYLIFNHGNYAVSSLVSLDAIRFLKQNPFNNHGNADRLFMLTSYDKHYTDVLIDNVDDNKVRIDNTGGIRGVFRIEGIR